jgi:hypothetical protein
VGARIDLRIGRLRVARSALESARLSSAGLQEAIVTELTARASGASNGAQQSLVSQIVDAIWTHEASAPLRDASDRRGGPHGPR